MSGEVWTFPPLLSDANKSSRSSSSSNTSTQNNNHNNHHGPVPLLPQYPPHNNINVLHQNPNNGNNNNVNAGVYERSINNDTNVQFAGEENKKYKVSVSFDRYVSSSFINDM